MISPGVGVERILINMTDPNKDVNGEKSQLGTPHPFQADLNVRQAYALAIQRDVMATQLYGEPATVTTNVLAASAELRLQEHELEVRRGRRQQAVG